MLGHSKLHICIVQMMHSHLHVINVECKASNQAYLWGNNRDLNEYYYGWINIWNNYYLKCDTQQRAQLNDKFVIGTTETMDVDHDIDIAKMYASKWDFHDELSVEMALRQRMGNLYRKCGKKIKKQMLFQHLV
eukprot:TRINITY_DN2830_c0_g1_i1.p1 TRINITY_DN2830_c0_g1~~TRINITY_DN2830_c0_g1_i1.p1  ORF type:complete len:133 (+),score=27.17 TRINITY_DN2830_c0_g1_i1:76-474(+)